jgi:MFS family permease
VNQTENKMSKNVILAIAVMTSFLTPFMGSSVIICSAGYRQRVLDGCHHSKLGGQFLSTLFGGLSVANRQGSGYIREKEGPVTWDNRFYNFLLPCGDYGIYAGFNCPQSFTGAGKCDDIRYQRCHSYLRFSARERGRALGINVASVYLGLSLGPFLGGILTESLGWRSIFWVNVPLGLIVIFMILWKLRGEWVEAKGEKFDFTGSVIYGASLICVMYGLSVLPELSAVWFVIAGFLCLLAFIRWEMKSGSPLLNLNLIRRNVVFALSNVAALINYSATFAVAFLLCLYLQYTQGMSAQPAGFFLIAQAVVMAVVSPLAGRFSDRIEPRVIATFGMALTAGGLLYFSFINSDTHTGFIILGLLIVGLGLALFSSPNTNAIMSSVKSRDYGVASAVLSTMRMIGNMLSMGIVTVLFAVLIGRVEITPEYYVPFLQSMKIAFIVFAGLCFLGIFASLARGGLRK